MAAGAVPALANGPQQPRPLDPSPAARDTEPVVLTGASFPPWAVAADGVVSTPAPVPGLDTDDEVAFMASDAGPAAPAATKLPAHVAGAYRISLTDPSNLGRQSYVYVMLADGDKHAPKPAFNAAN